MFFVILVPLLFGRFDVNKNTGKSGVFAESCSRHADKNLAVRMSRAERVNRVNAFAYKYFNTVANCR